MCIVTKWNRTKKLVRFATGSWVKMANIDSYDTELDDLWKSPFKVQSYVSSGYNLVGVASQDDDIINPEPVPVDQLALWRRVEGRSSESVAYEFKRILQHRNILGIKQYQPLWADGTKTWEYANLFSRGKAIK
eukprot:Awhi_evm1s14469